MPRIEAVSAMAEMSKAIREQLQKHGRTLKEIPYEELKEYAAILGAFYYDIQEELERR